MFANVINKYEGEPNITSSIAVVMHRLLGTDPDMKKNMQLPQLQTMVEMDKRVGPKTRRYWNSCRDSRGNIIHRDFGDNNFEPQKMTYEEKQDL